MKYSVLDLSPICQGSTAAESFRHSLDLAQHAESWGYHRYWLAEHHNIPGVASSATSVLIGHIAGGTQRIRVGSGGVMLPNHAPLVIAEQFGTLESLYPGRIDLGLGRAPGGDTLTSRALRRFLGSNGDTFPQDLAELQSYFRPASDESKNGAVRAIPGAGLSVPIYLLGSSDFSARLAAECGLPFAFASHFAPTYLQMAKELYFSRFTPSSFLREPWFMVGVNVVVADTDAEARRLFTTPEQQFLNLIRRTLRELPPPVESMDGLWSPSEEAHVRQMLRCSAVGSPATVRATLQILLKETEAQELIITAPVYSHTARLRSYELAAEVLQSLGTTRGEAAPVGSARRGELIP